MKENNEVKVCARCKKEKPTTDFRLQTSKGYTFRASYCGPCESEYSKEHYSKTKDRRQELHKEWRKTHPESLRKYQLKGKYGITEDQYQEMYDAQEGKCFICGDYQEVLCVDHSHETGKVRKLLCKACNLGLGKFKDNPLVVQRAADYLRENS